MLARFVANLVIGLALLAILHAPPVARNAAVVSARDAVLSWQMEKLSGAVPFDAFAFIDADEKTQATWGFHAVTPRGQIARLVDFALRGNPSAVLVDFDLTWRDPDGARGDADLARVLNLHRLSCKNRCVPVLLVRDVAPTARFYLAGTRDRMALAPVPSYLDAVFATSPAVVWGTAGNQQDDDGAVRRWYLWENVCAHEGKALVLPSVSLLGAAAATGTPLEAVNARLQALADYCAPGGTRRVESAQVQSPFELHLRGGVSVTLSNSGIDRRIFYRLPWTQDADDTNDGGRLIVLPARRILANTESDSSLVRGKIVVIGSSASVAGDSEATPLGMMPGSLVLINAMNTIARGDQLHETGFAGSMAIEVLLIVLVSFLFAVLPSAIALAISLVLLFAGTLTIGFIALNSGVWIDTVLPTLGVIAHEAVHRLRHYVHSLKHTPYKHAG